MTSITSRSTSPSRAPTGAAAGQQDDLARSYAARVGGLHAKLSRIAANQREIAHSLGRAAAALRALAVN